MYTQETYAYKNASGCDIHAEVYRSSDQEVRPVILFLHGGALIIGNRFNMPPDQVEYYVERGYAVVSIDHRLATQVTFEAVIEDIEDAYQWMVEKGPELFQIDPQRVVTVGHSVGGYLALLFGFRVSPKPKVVCSFHGYGDPSGDWLSRPDTYYNSSKDPISREEAFKGMQGPVITGTPYDGPLRDEREPFYFYCRQHGLWPKEVSGHCPHEEPEFWQPYIPLKNVTKDFPPTIFVHGEEDFDVPIDQPHQMMAELDKHGVPNAIVPVAGRGHAFDHEGDGMKDPVIKDAFDQYMEFVSKYV